jgi:hypothetical protein
MGCIDEKSLLFDKVQKSALVLELRAKTNCNELINSYKFKNILFKLI